MLFTKCVIPRQGISLLIYYELNLSLRKINANLQLHKSRIVIHGRTKIIRFTGMFVI